MKKIILLTILFISLIACEDNEMEYQLLPEEISSINLLNNPVIYEPENIAITIENSAAKVDSVVMYLDEEIIFSKLNATNFNFQFDPEEYTTGLRNLKISVFQNGNKITNKEYPITIHRKLLEVELDEYFFRPEFEDYVLFASAKDGSLLAVKQIDAVPLSFVLTTEVNIEEKSPYMLTIASRFLNEAQESVIVNSVDGLTRATFKKFTPKPPKRKNLKKQWKLNTIGFSQDLVATGSNNSHYGTGFDGVDFSFFIIEYNILNDVTDLENFYVTSFDRTAMAYKHMWLNKNDFTSDFVVNADNLTSENQEERSIDASYEDGFENGYERSLLIKGYQSQNDFDNNKYHSIWSSSYGVLQSPNMFILPNQTYTLNTSFYKYSYILQLEDYLTIRTGTPLEQYSIPNWNLDFGIQNKNITVMSSGIGHNVGKILISSGNFVDELPMVDGKMLMYSWNINFDSANTTTVRLPELPDELEAWNFGKFLQSSTPEIKWVRLERYENISDYDSYLQKIIKENKAPLQVSPVYEAKFKSNDEYNYFIYDEDTFFY
tara:strand:- start:86 stop:1726 length:1641 start_codon:yes stop_codon:yes gene_type:complete